jgi:hypothetical protein
VKDLLPKDRKHELQQKAIQLFVKKGHEKTTLRDLGKAVDIKGPGVYHYFKSKKDLCTMFNDHPTKTFGGEFKMTKGRTGMKMISIAKIPRRLLPEVVRRRACVHRSIVMKGRIVLNN